MAYRITDQDEGTYFERLFDLWMEGFSAVNPQFDAYVREQIKQQHPSNVPDVQFSMHDEWMTITYGRYGNPGGSVQLNIMLVIDGQDDLIRDAGRRDGYRYADIPTTKCKKRSESIFVIE